MNTTDEEKDRNFQRGYNDGYVTTLKNGPVEISYEDIYSDNQYLSGYYAGAEEGFHDRSKMELLGRGAEQAQDTQEIQPEAEHSPAIPNPMSMDIANALDERSNYLEAQEYYKGFTDGYEKTLENGWMEYAGVEIEGSELFQQGFDEGLGRAGREYDENKIRQATSEKLTQTIYDVGYTHGYSEIRYSFTPFKDATFTDPQDQIQYLKGRSDGCHIAKTERDLKDQEKRISNDPTNPIENQKLETRQTEWNTVKDIHTAYEARFYDRRFSERADDDISPETDMDETPEPRQSDDEPTVSDSEEITDFETHRVEELDTMREDKERDDEKELGHETEHASDYDNDIER